MYTGFKPSNSVSKTVVSGIGQSQLETLQRQVDTYTRKLEQEKKKYFNIQDTHKIVSEQYQKQKSKLDELKKQNTKAQNIILQAKIKNLEASLQKAVTTYDETQAYNMKLKGQINMLRREKKNFIQSKAMLQQQIKNHEKEIEKKMHQIQSKKDITEGLKLTIGQIKTKNEQERDHYIDQFDRLEKDYLKEKRQREMFKFEKDLKPEPIDTQPLLKHRLKKLIRSNKNKIKMIEQYKKHMKLIQEAFSQIKRISGIQDLSEITNTFIKSQEQNYSLYNYMDTLSRNIDSLQKQNAQLEQNIKKQDQTDNENKKKMQEIPEQEKRTKQLQKYIKKKEDATLDLKKLIELIKPSLSTSLLELASSQLNDDPNKLAEYQLGININERTVQGYLSDLQKFINNLLILKQEAKPKIGNSTKDNVTTYSKPIPNITEQVIVKEKASTEQLKFMEQQRFRQYAMEFWEKKKNKPNGNNKQ